eukprot:725413_1
MRNEKEISKPRDASIFVFDQNAPVWFANEGVNRTVSLQFEVLSEQTASELPTKVMEPASTSLDRDRIASMKTTRIIVINKLSCVFGFHFFFKKMSDTATNALKFKF